MILAVQGNDPPRRVRVGFCYVLMRSYPVCSAAIELDSRGVAKGLFERVERVCQRRNPTMPNRSR